MSNYPAPPPYGGPYNSSIPLPPPAGANYSGISQYPYPYPQPDHASFMHGPNQPNGPPSAQHTKAYTYNASTHGMTNPVYSNGMAQAPFARYGGQVQQHAISPAQFVPPPVSPYGASPYALPQPSVQPLTSLSAFQSYHNPPITHSNQQGPPTAYSASTVKPKSPAAIVPDLEDGELSGRGSSKSMDDVDTNTSTDRGPVKSVPRANLKVTEGTSSNNSTKSFHNRVKGN